MKAILKDCAKCGRAHIIDLGDGGAPIKKAPKTANPKEYSVTDKKNNVQVGGWNIMKVDPTTLTERDRQFVPTQSKYFLRRPDYDAVLGMGIAKNRPVLMIGPKGTGKSTQVKDLASYIGIPYRRIQLNGATGTEELLGRFVLINGETQWVNGVLIDAMLSGHWVQVDEINAASAEILFALHSLLDDDHYIVLSEYDGRVITPSPRFRLFASMNPSGGNYHGTRALNAAFLDRFLCLTIDYPERADEIKIIENRTGLPKMLAEKIVDVAANVRKSAEDGQIYCDMSTRELIDWADAAQYLGVLDAAKTTILGKLDKDDRGKVYDFITARFVDNAGVSKDRSAKDELVLLAS